MLTKKRKSPESDKSKTLEEILAESKKRTKRNEFLIIVGTLIVIALVSVSVIFFNLNKGQESNPAPGVEQATATASLSKAYPSQVIERSVSPQSEAEAKTEALNNLALILEGLRVNETSLDTKLEALENGDYSSIPEDVRSLIYIPEGNQDIRSLLGSYEKTSLQSLVSIGTYGISGEGKTYTGSDKDLSEIIYMPEVGLMYLPLNSIKDAKTSSYIFEMVYVDSQWKLVPINVLVQTYQSSLYSNSSK